MTRAEALAEARRRWGPDAFVDDDLVKEVAHSEGFLVSRRGAGGLFVVAGQGSSWEAAFADADRRAAQSLARTGAAAIECLHGYDCCPECDSGKERGA